MTLDVLPLHHNPHLAEACGEVLNEEWPRSKTARIYSLSKSSDKLPYSIALVEKDNDKDSVIGYSRLCHVHGISKACFIESVVVKTTKRGQGFGRKLMDLTEKVALRLGFTTFYLTTHDKQDFYHHLGYEYCDAVISLGAASSLLSEDMRKKLLGDPDADHMSNNKVKKVSSQSKTADANEKTMKDCPERNTERDANEPASSDQPPPAPNLPSVITQVPSFVAVPLPPPPPPCPPTKMFIPPPPPSLNAFDHSSTKWTPQRLPKDQAYWMRKIISL